jgi:tetratricopeptide (TPR) repeat protein
MTDEEHIAGWPSADKAGGLIGVYKQASRSNPYDAQLHFDYGITFLELGAGFEDHAVEAFKTAAALHPSWAAVHFQLGLAYASSNLREEAIGSYKQAVTLQPEDINTLAAFAHASLLLGRHEEAEWAATRMIEVAPLASGAYLISGMAQLLQSRYADADGSLHRAVSLESDLAEAYYGIGLASIALGNDSVVQLQCERLRALDWRLAGKLIEHRQREIFMPAEFMNELLEIAADVRK